MTKNKSPKSVQLFVTCLVDAFYPEVGLAVVALLEKQGLTVTVPANQTCCGQPAFNAGVKTEAQAMARYTLDILSQTSGPILLPSGSCAAMIIHHYPEILAADPTYAAKATEVASRTYEFSQFLVDALGVTDVGATCQQGVTYHPSCHGLRNLDIKAQPEALLSNVNGVEHAPLPAAEECCGFGGLFAIKLSPISGAMLEQKLDNVLASGAEVLLGGDVSCLMHMAGGLKKRGSAIEVKHLAQFLYEQGEQS